MKEIKPTETDAVTGAAPKLLPPLDTSYLHQTVVPGLPVPVDIPDYAPPESETK